MLLLEETARIDMCLQVLVVVLYVLAWRAGACPRAGHVLPLLAVCCPALCLRYVGTKGSLVSCFFFEIPFPISHLSNTSLEDTAPDGVRCKLLPPRPPISALLSHWSSSARPGNINRRTRTTDTPNGSNKKAVITLPASRHVGH